MRAHFAGLLVLLLLTGGLASPALAQAPVPPRKPDPKAPIPGKTFSTDELLIAGCRARRAGSLSVAAPSFEAALEQMPGRTPAEKMEKRLIAEQLFDLLRYQSPPKLDKLRRIFQENQDFENEFKLLFEQNKVDEALALARWAKSPRDEAKALAKLGRLPDALKIFDEKGLKREKAEALAEARQAVQAAELYAELADYYSQAQQLEAARNPQAAKLAWADARDQLLDEVREAVKLSKAAEDAFTAAQGPVRRETARIRKARCYAVVAEKYERLALVYSKTGQPADKTAQLASLAARFVTLQRDTLIDDQPQIGPDKGGKLMVDAMGLPARIQQLEARAREYAAAPPPRR